MQAQSARTQTGPVQIGMVITALITAFIHLYLAMQMMAEGISGTMFILNGLGYIGLLVALFVPQSLVNRFLPSGLASKYRSIVRWILIGYTLLTILLWVAFGMRDLIAYIDKLAEAALVVLLWLDRSRD